MRPDSNPSEDAPSLGGVSTSLTVWAHLALFLLAKTPSVDRNQSYRPCIHPGQALQAETAGFGAKGILAHTPSAHAGQSRALPASCWGPLWARGGARTEWRAS